METIGTVTDAYRDGNDVVLTVVRNSDANYRHWKVVMDAIEQTIQELASEGTDMTCHECGERGNFVAHLKETENGKIRWKQIYLCGKHMNEFVTRRMHQQRAKA